ncbi:MAG TPA: hypothetical protein PLN71_17995 [Anaerolineae bacterium]|nr:hypothetical protein [Anaerolineae bacterium]
MDDLNGWLLLILAVFILLYGEYKLFSFLLSSLKASGVPIVVMAIFMAMVGAAIGNYRVFKNIDRTKWGYVTSIVIVLFACAGIVTYTALFPKGITVESASKDRVEVLFTDAVLSPVCYGFLEFELSFVNNTNKDLAINLTGDDIKISDDKGRVFSDVSWKQGASEPTCYDNKIKGLKLDKVARGQRTTFAFRVVGVPEWDASKIIVEVILPDSTHDNKWEIPLSTFPKPIAQYAVNRSLIARDDQERFDIIKLTVTTIEDSGNALKFNVVLKNIVPRDAMVLRGVHWGSKMNSSQIYLSHSNAQKARLLEVGGIFLVDYLMEDGEETRGWLVFERPPTGDFVLHYPHSEGLRISIPLANKATLTPASKVTSTPLNRATPASSSDELPKLIHAGAYELIVTDIEVKQDIMKLYFTVKNSSDQTKSWHSDEGNPNIYITLSNGKKIYPIEMGGIFMRAHSFKSKDQQTGWIAFPVPEERQFRFHYPNCKPASLQLQLP